MLRCVSRTLIGLALGAALASGSATPALAAPAERLARCIAPAPGDDDSGLDQLAADGFLEEYGGTRKRALRWMQVQGAAMQLDERIRARRAPRKDLMRMVFDNDRLKVRVFMRNHKHDAAIRYCARQLGINKYVAIGIHRWSEGDLNRAVIRTIRAVKPLHDARLFECSSDGGDYFRIDVYAPATDEQVAQITAAARATKVPFKLRRHAEPMPVAEVL